MPLMWRGRIYPFYGRLCHLAIGGFYGVLGVFPVVSQCDVVEFFYFGVMFVICKSVCFMVF